MDGDFPYWETHHALADVEITTLGGVLSPSEKKIYKSQLAWSKGQ